MISLIGFKSDIIVYIWILLIISAVIRSILNKFNERNKINYD